MRLSKKGQPLLFLLFLFVPSYRLGVQIFNPQTTRLPFLDATVIYLNIHTMIIN